MRYHEIFEAAAPRIPDRYDIDPETDLAVNPPEQWSQSPYLGAVKSSTGTGYRAQAHIPQDVWVTMVQQNPHKWQNAPKTFFNEVGNQRTPMIDGPYQDPRQAAWLVQEILYGGDYTTLEIMEDFFEEKFCNGDGALWRSIKARIPNFEGELLTVTDKETFFAGRDERRKAQTVQKNASEYELKMPQKIKKALVDLFIKNKELIRKRLGRKVKSQAELEQIINDIVDSKGIEYFVTSPGSVKIKDLASLKLA